MKSLLKHPISKLPSQTCTSIRAAWNNTSTHTQLRKVVNNVFHLQMKLRGDMQLLHRKQFGEDMAFSYSNKCNEPIYVAIRSVNSLSPCHNHTLNDCHVGVCNADSTSTRCMISSWKIGFVMLQISRLQKRTNMKIPTPLLEFLCHLLSFEKKGEVYISLWSPEDTNASDEKGWRG